MMTYFWKDISDFTTPEIARTFSWAPQDNAARTNRDNTKVLLESDDSNVLRLVPVRDHMTKEQAIASGEVEDIARSVQIEVGNPPAPMTDYTGHLSLTFRDMTYSELKAGYRQAGIDFKMLMADRRGEKRDQEAKDFLLSRGFSSDQIDDFTDDISESDALLAMSLSLDPTFVEKFKLKTIAKLGGGGAAAYAAYEIFKVLG